MCCNAFSDKLQAMDVGKIGHTFSGSLRLIQPFSELCPAITRRADGVDQRLLHAALAVIDERGVHQALVDAVRAARDRGAELGELLDRA